MSKKLFKAPGKSFSFRQPSPVCFSGEVKIGDFGLSKMADHSCLERASQGQKGKVVVFLVYCTVLCFRAGVVDR